MSKIFNLVALRPAKFIPNSKLSNQGGGQYSVTFPYEPDEVFQVSDSKSFTWNQSINLLTVTGLTGTPNITVFFYVRLTESEDRYLAEDPENDTGDDKIWSARVKGDIIITQSAVDALAGVVSVSSSSVRVINNDNFFKDILSSEYSWNDKSCEIWQSRDDVISKTFTGFVNTLVPGADTIKFTVKSNETAYTIPANMGDTQDDYLIRASKYPDIDPRDEGKVLPYHFGPITFYNYEQTQDAGGYGQDIVNLNLLFQTFRTTPNPQPGGTKSEILIGRIVSGGLLAEDFEVTYTARVYNAGETPVPTTEYTLLNISDARYFIGGERIGIRDQPGVNGFVYHEIKRIDYQLGIVTIETGVIVYLAGMVLQKPKPIVLFQEFDSGIRAEDHTEYDIIQTALDSGNIEVMVESSAVQFVIGTHFIMWMNEENHDVSLKRIVEKSGLTTDATSFTDAGSALDANINMSIPSFSERKLANYYTYIQQITESTLSYLLQDGDGVIFYELLASPFADVNNVTDDDLIGDITLSLDLVDIAPRISFNNEFISYPSQKESTSISQEDEEYEVFQSSTKERQVEHRLNDITNRVDAFLEHSKNLRNRYRFAVSSNFLNLEIGDPITVESRQVTNNDNKITLLIVAKTRKRNSVEFTGLEVFV